MAIMKRDVNLGLLLLIVAALLVFSGFTVYYQTTFKNLSTTYQNQLKALDAVSKDLESKRGQLNATSVQLQIKQQKEEDLRKKYVDTESERTQLAQDLQRQVDNLNSEVNRLRAKVDCLTTQKAKPDAEEGSC